MAGHSLASENGSSQCFLLKKEKKISGFLNTINWYIVKLDFMKEIKEANTFISY